MSSFIQQFDSLSENWDGEIDETFFQYDEYDADRKKARGVGEKISFTDALFMDPETGKYPKIFGRTEDREKNLLIQQRN